MIHILYFFFQRDYSVSDLSGYPQGFQDNLQNDDEHLGYVKLDESYAPTGWYAPGTKTQYDFQDGGNTDPRGLVEETRDAFDNRSTVAYDDYKVMPVSSRQYLDATNFLETTADYDYRILQPWMVTDPNGNRSVFGFSPLGLLMKSGVIGKVDASEGDIITEDPFDWMPSVRMEYDFMAWYEEQKPVWVKTIQNEQHYQDDTDSPTIAKVEFSDGFGRLLQTRAQAEDVIFGATADDRIFGDSGLPADQEANNANATGTEHGSTDPLNAVVSGWQVYDNKGRVVEQYEPFFSQGLDDYAQVEESQKGESLTMFYDPAGRVVRTVNPDGSEQRLVVGIPPDLENPDNFSPSPWHHYAYDANDLAPITHFGNTIVPSSHEFTPKSEIVDALGRTIKTIEHEAASDNGQNPVYEDVVMKYEYDIRGNLKKVTDALDRQAFAYSYDLANQPLKTTHIDSGASDAVIDAAGKPVEGNDAKEATVLNVYDTLNRPQLLWAKDHGTDSFSLRQITLYGDGPFADLTQQQAAAKNLLGQAYKTYDESGLIVANEFDFKGNLLKKSQKVLKDSLLQSTSAYTVDWPMPDDSNFDTLTSGLLEHKAHENDTNTDGYITENTFDALNRVVQITLPKDVDDNRKEILPTYNRAGALEKVTFDQTGYVNHIAYNAKGQRILLALGNGVMTRYTYDNLTFRLVRQRTETYSQDGWEYTPGGNVKQDTGYTYDLAGNIINTTENRTDAGFGTTLAGGQGPTPHELIREFDYDPLYRLILATGREDTSHSHNLIWQDTTPVSPTPANSREYRRTYQYDKMGNILKLAHTAHQANFTRNFGYHSNMQHNKLDEVLDNSQNTLTNFLYDAAGNTIQNNSERFYTWDAANQLKQFKIDDGQTVSVYGQYIYSGGQRVKKLVKDQQGNFTVTVYIDGVFEYQKLIKGTNTFERNYTHIIDDRSRIATVRAGSDEDDITENAFYLVEDHLNSSTARLKATDGSVIDREEFYPFGETCLHSFSKKRYRYTGKEKDSESGLYYYGARYYSAWCCRFISIDPLAADYSHLSPYNYAGNKPINARDINGMNGENESKGASGSNAAQSGGKDTVQNEVIDLGMVHFINKDTGKHLGSHDFGGEGESIRSIDQNDYRLLTEGENNFKTIPANESPSLPEISVEGNSSEVNIDMDQISGDLQAMSEVDYDEHGRIIENSMYLIYDSASNSISSEVRNEGNTYGSTADAERVELIQSGPSRGMHKLIDHPPSSVILAQIHTHPDANFISIQHRSVRSGAIIPTSGTYNEPGVSERDYNLSKQFPVYAIALFQDNSLKGKHPDKVSIYNILGSAKNETEYSTMDQSYKAMTQNPFPLVRHALINR